MKRGLSEVKATFMTNIDDDIDDDDEAAGRLEKPDLEFQVSGRGCAAPLEGVAWGRNPHGGPHTAQWRYRAENNEARETPRAT